MSCVYLISHLNAISSGTVRSADIRMERELKQLVDDSIKACLSQDEIKELLGIDRRKISNKLQYFRSYRLLVLFTLISGIAVSTINYSQTGNDFFRYVEEEYCMLEHTMPSLELMRPMTNCSMCKDLIVVPTVAHVSKEDFRKKYAYSGVPVLVTNATENWTALRVFNFQFLKRLYNHSKAYTSKTDDFNDGCQFFPYLTNFKSLKEVFEMSEERAALHEDQWYVGWSNCDIAVMNVIRKHYNKPDFIPSDSESSELDWIFIGGHGKGAQMHIDFVDRPSWQAQILGKKTWTLAPPPECEQICHRLTVTVSKGDILAIDTNQWYHQTYIHPGEMSITIGSEYD